MHNLLLCIRVVLSLVSVSSPPRRSPFVSSAALHCPLHSPPHFPLSSRLRSPRDPKSTESGKDEGEKESGGVQERRDPRPDYPNPNPPISSSSSSSSVAPIWGAGDGDGLRIFAQGHRQQLRRPCRVSQCSALPGPSRPFSPFLHLLVLFF